MTYFYLNKRIDRKPNRITYLVLSPITVHMFIGTVLLFLVFRVEKITEKLSCYHGPPGGSSFVATEWFDRGVWLTTTFPVTFPVLAVRALLILSYHIAKIIIHYVYKLLWEPLKVAYLSLGSALLFQAYKVERVAEKLAGHHRPGGSASFHATEWHNRGIWWTIQFPLVWPIVTLRAVLILAYYSMKNFLYCLGEVIDVIRELLAQFFIHILNLIRPVLRWICDTLRPFLLFVKKVFLRIIEIIKPVLDWILRLVKRVWNWTVELIETIWDWTSYYIMKIWRYIVALAKTVWNWISFYVRMAWSGAVRLAKMIWNWISPYIIKSWRLIVKIITTAWDMILFYITNVWQKIVNLVNSIWDWVSHYLMKTWRWLVDFVKTVWGWISFYIGMIWSRVVRQVKTIWGWAALLMHKIWHRVVVIVKAVWHWFAMPVKIIWRSIVAVVTTAWSWATVTITLAWRRLSAILKFLFGVAKEILQTALGYVKITMSSIANTAKRTLYFLLEAMKKSAKNLKKIIS